MLTHLFKLLKQPFGFFFVLLQVPAATEIKMSVLEIPDAVPVEKRFPLSLKLMNTRLN